MGNLKVESKQTVIKVGEHKGEKMYVMKVKHYNTLKADNIIEYAANSSNIPKAMLRASWEALGDIISSYALEGHIVEIPGVGNIRAEIRAKAQKRAKDVSADDVIRRKFILYPNSSIKDELYRTKLSIECLNSKGNTICRTESTDAENSKDKM